MSRREENRDFICKYCNKHVLPLRNGYRNHCPFCLVSLHVDHQPGDRACHCYGLMLPKRVVYKKRLWQIVHQCQKCGTEKTNRVAEGSLQPDDWEALVKLSAASLAKLTPG